MSHEQVRATVLEEGTVLRVLLDRPKGNVLTIEMMEAIGRALDAHRDDRRIKLVFLRGAGGAFSYGVSVEEHTPELAPKMLATFHGLMRKIAAYPAPVASLVEGRCLGGAFELVLCSHLVFATKNAVFGCPEIQLGVLPPVLAVLGTHRLGSGRAERMMLTGDSIDSEEALHAGLVACIVDGPDPEATLLAWVRSKLAPLSAPALRRATHTFRRASGILELLGEKLEAAERYYLEEVMTSMDGKEGIRAFVERRKPRWEER